MAMNGMEMMLRGMGMAPVLDGAKQLADAGTFAKIVAFADGLDELQRTIAALREEIKELRNERRREQIRDFEPCPGSWFLPNGTEYRSNVDGAKSDQ